MIHKVIVLSIQVCHQLLYVSSLDGSDYSAVAPRPLTFDRDTSSFPIPIDIIDDQVHELSEDFFGHLSTTDEDVVLDPQETRVRIADNDGMPQVQS